MTGVELRKIRKVLNMNLEEFGVLVHKSASQVCRYETGDRNQIIPEELAFYINHHMENKLWKPLQKNK